MSQEGDGNGIRGRYADKGQMEGNGRETSEIVGYRRQRTESRGRWKPNIRRGQT